MIYGIDFDEYCETEEEREEKEEELRQKADRDYDAMKDEQVEGDGNENGW